MYGVSSICFRGSDQLHLGILHSRKLAVYGVSGILY